MALWRGGGRAFVLGVAFGALAVRGRAWLARGGAEALGEVCVVRGESGGRGGEGELGAVVAAGPFCGVNTHAHACRNCFVLPR